jgi:hypothetical protein
MTGRPRAALRARCAHHAWSVLMLLVGARVAAYKHVWLIVDPLVPRSAGW